MFGPLERPSHEYLPIGHKYRVFGFKTYSVESTCYKDLRNMFETWLYEGLREHAVGIESDKENHSLENYHLLVDTETHHAFIKSFGRDTSSIISEKTQYLNEIIEQVESEFRHKCRIYNQKTEFRVVRPNMHDHNEMHRDNWFPYFNNLINIYLPLAGSNPQSALPIIPTSHLWDDEDVTPLIKYGENKKYINPETGVAYSVSPIKDSKKPLDWIHRPDVVDGGYMLFSPRCVHGGGSNHSEETRFSLEIRLELLSS